ncbi:50S ribosomal protein L3 [Galenea microaerophila]
MSIGIIGKKVGMTRVFTEDGVSIPVTVVKVDANRITQLKTEENDGYSAVQVTAGSVHAGRVNKPSAGHFAKAGVEAGEGLWEFRVSADELANYEVGAEVSVEVLDGVEKVDVTGTTKGKGFAGAVKRHNFATQDFSHGNSVSHRAPGSIGQNQTPGRVFKGKKMAGHMGNVRQTTLNLDLVKVDPEKGLLLIKGAVPGAKESVVMVTKAVK